MDAFDLPNRDILTLDAILITGILIFMTVSSYAEIGSFNEDRSVFQVVAFMIACFSFSSILLIWSSFQKLEGRRINNNNVRIGGALVTFVGFLFLIIFAFQLAFF